MTRKLIYFLLVLALALGSVGLAACGGGDEEGDGNGLNGDGLNGDGGVTEEPTSGGELCEDVPVYPGADDVEKVDWSWSGRGAAGFGQVRWHYYSTDDSVENVMDYYKNKMPDEGWEKATEISTDEYAMLVWTKDDGDTGAGIGAGWEDGKTYVGVWCGQGLEDGMSTEEPTEEPAEEPTEEPAEEPAEEPTSPVGGGDVTWDDVPVYPGADRTMEFSGSMGGEEGDCDRLEWRYYEVSADPADVADYYLDEMPGHGWTKYGEMKMSGVGAWSMWTKGDGADAAYIYAMGDGEEDTVLMMWRGVNCEL